MSYLNSAHTRFVHLTDRSINYVNKGKITKSIKFDEISLIKLTATPLFGHIVPARNSAGIVLSFIVIGVAFAGFLQSLRGFIIFIMSAVALILPFFISKLIFSKITEGKFSFREGTEFKIPQNAANFRKFHETLRGRGILKAPQI